MLAAWISTSTSRGPGTGSGRSPYSRTSGPPKARKNMARINGSYADCWIRNASPPGRSGEDSFEVDREARGLLETAFAMELHPAGFREDQPDLARAGQEIGGDLLAQFLSRVRRRDHFDTELRGARVRSFETVGLQERLARPGDIRDEHAGLRKDGRFDERPAAEHAQAADER